jgi:cellulose synthase/poly-beta-1,6-N-acetylglucosamine synthase-like glycosyltransferase
MPSQKPFVISCLIPSFHRERDLERCLTAILAQNRQPDEVLVVARAGDTATYHTVASWRERIPLRLVEITVPGQVQALNAGLARCIGDVVVITDDDAAPRPDWVSRIEAHFVTDEKIGAVGGRDWVNENGVAEMGARRISGKILWFGRVIGNHHLGFGPARDVDILKGVNCAFRLAAIRPIGFDPRLRGIGAQVHNDMLACLSIRHAGWRIVYDPAIGVDHYPAPRFDRDQRNVFDARATADRAFNFRLALSAVSPPWRRAAAIFWHRIVGTGEAPGCARVLVMLAKRDGQALLRYQAVRAALSGER